jgi:hypothetical protein
MPKDYVPCVSIRRDPRFELEEQWYKSVIPAIEEARTYGCEVEVTTVIYKGRIEGWYFHGWYSPPCKILYEFSSEEIKEIIEEINYYVI